MEFSTDTDVLIVGAGPAGLACAIELGKKNIAVLLIDKADFPRDKSCGGGLGIRSVRLLNELLPGTDIGSWSAFEEKIPIHEVAVGTPRGYLYPFRAKPVNGVPPVLGYVAERRHLDQLLLQKATAFPSVRFLSGLKANSITEQEKGVRVEGKNFAFFSKYALDARGVNIRDSSRRAFALTATYKGINGNYLQKSRIEFWFLRPVYPGYLWLFPNPGGLTNTGIYLPPEYSKLPVTSLRDTFFHLIEIHPQVRERFSKAEAVTPFKGAWLPLGPSSDHEVCGRILKAGDSACLVDPLAGEGIGNALMSGKMAAEYIGNALAQEGNGKVYTEIYRNRIQTTFVPEFIRRRRVLRIISAFPFWFEILFKKIHKSQELQKMLSDAIQHPKSSKKHTQLFWVWKFIT